MTQINKIPAGNGAQWLLDGFALLRKAPLALGLLGLIWGGLSAVASMTGQLWLSLLLGMFGPLLLGGVAFAAREVEQDRRAHPGHLLQGLREGKLARFLMLLLPQLAALVVIVLLLGAMVGEEQLQHIVEVMRKLQADPENPDPALLQSLPVDAMFAWLIAAMVVGLIATLFAFVAIPEVMFTDRNAFAAMALSFRACLRNLGAVLVFMLLFVIAMFAISIAVNIVVAVLALAVGRGPALLLGQLLMMAVLAPLIAAATCSAWRQMLGGTVPPPLPSTGIEV